MSGVRPSKHSGHDEVRAPAAARYLRERQYRDSSNLNARAELHRSFSTNPYNWFRWVFDHLNLPCRCRILELGCGPAGLWLENLRRLPAEWEVYLSDFSLGMVREARAKLGDNVQFHCAVADVQSLPFGSACVDAVIANHMLHHVPDLDHALAEVRRVLRVGGQFYAATNGPAHMRELAELIHQFDPSLPDRSEVERPFDLRTGRDQLVRRFAEVRGYRYEDSLVVTEAEALVAYVFSMSPPHAPEPRHRADFAEFVRWQLATGGPIRITKDVGMLVAVRA